MNKTDGGLETTLESTKIKSFPIRHPMDQKMDKGMATIRDIHNYVALSPEIHNKLLNYWKYIINSKLMKGQNHNTTIIALIWLVHKEMDTPVDHSKLISYAPMPKAKFERCYCKLKNALKSYGSNQDEGEVAKTSREYGKILELPDNYV